MGQLGKNAQMGRNAQVGMQSAELSLSAITSATALLDLDVRKLVTTEKFNGEFQVTSWLNAIPAASDAFTDGGNSSRRPRLEIGVWSAGNRSVKFDGNDYLSCTSGLANALAGGSDNSWSVAIVGQFTTLPLATRALMSFGYSGASNKDFIDIGQDSGTAWRVAKRDDSSTQITRTGGTPDTSKHVLIITHSGIAVQFYVGAVSQFVTTTQNVANTIIDQMAIGGRFIGSSADLRSEMRVVRIVGFDGELSGADITTITDKFTTQYL